MSSLLPSIRTRRSLVLAPLLALGATVAFASCGDPELTSSGKPPCSTVYTGLCGAKCSTDTDCAPGLYCAAGACTADCHPTEAPCPEGGTCDPHGHCGGGAGGAGGSTTFDPGTGGTTSGGGGQGGSCADIVVEFAPQTPTVVLLIDQSGSMTADFNGQSRWDVVYDTLMDPVDGVVKQLEAKVRFGLVLYSFTQAPAMCPELVKALPPALNNFAAIDAVYAPETPSNNTPTGESITAITPELVAFAEPGPKLIVLATDGDPDRCADPNGHDQISKDISTAAVQAAFAQGIETVVIAVGDQVSQQHQQDMSNAGKGLAIPAPSPCDPVADPANCAPTYTPTTKQDMVTAFTDIINGKRTCVFTLNGQVIQGKECDGTVTVNNANVPCNDPNGYHLNSPSELEFVGTVCDTIMNDPNVEITASFPCDSVTGVGGGPN